MLLLRTSRAEVYCTQQESPLLATLFSPFPTSQPSPPPLTPLNPPVHLTHTPPLNPPLHLLHIPPLNPPLFLPCTLTPPLHAQITTQWCLLSPGPPWIHTKQCHDGQSEHLHARARREVSQERSIIINLYVYNNFLTLAYPIPP